MDPERELKADNALRDLFREVGHQHPPIGIDERIMQRIADAAPAIVKHERPLVPPFFWMVGAVLLTASIALALFDNGAAEGVPYVNRLRDLLPSISITGMLSSPWSMMTGAGIIALLLLDTMLWRGRMRAQPH